jgi:hypothetical protein
MGERCSHLAIATVNLKICNFLLLNFLHIYDMKFVNNLCVHNDTSTKILKRLTVKDKNLPTPINFKRVDKVLSSTVDSCWLWTIRFFNIISLHLGERGGSKVAILHCYVGSIASEPGLSSNSQKMTLTHYYCDLSSNSLCDVIGAHCYYDRAPLLMTKSSNG